MSTIRRDRPRHLREGATSVKRFLIATASVLLLAVSAIAGTANFPWH
jgi:hypothetical protein